MKIKHIPWMLETAYRYLMAAETLIDNPMLGRQAQTNAALAIEILFKSFSAEITLNKGEDFEQYSSTFGHDLIDLIDELPKEVQHTMGLSCSKDSEEPLTNARRMLERYRSIFMDDRYIYETYKISKQNEVKQIHKRLEKDNQKERLKKKDLKKLENIGKLGEAYYRRPEISPRFIGLARDLINTTIKIYKETGCEDSSIKSLYTTLETQR